MFVNPAKEQALKDRWTLLGIQNQDVLERFILSGGKGGQHTNKASTCVYLKHLPTGIEIKCQETRSQGMNRFLARRLLADKIETLQKGRESAEQQRIEKIRRQKRKRSRRAKEKMLADKRFTSQKKQSRSSSWSED